MSLKPEPLPPVPEPTARLAHIVCPKGNLCLWIGEERSAVFRDELVASCFPRRGQPAEAPWRRALITVLPFVEGLADRQAAQAVRTRIDWKYALRLELEDLGCAFSVLCEFRARRVPGNEEALLGEARLRSATERGWREGARSATHRFPPRPGGHPNPESSAMGGRNRAPGPQWARPPSPTGCSTPFHRNGMRALPRAGKSIDSLQVARSGRTWRN
jgi:hypothetical protein